MQLERYLELLHGDLQQGERIEVRYKLEPGNPRSRMDSYHFKGTSQAAEWLKEKLDAYIGINPRRGTGTKNEDVTRVKWVVADIDHPSEDVEYDIAKFGLVPTMVVASGNGYHLYWRTKEPPTQQVRKEFGRLGGSDPVHEPARILRPPETFNAKDLDNLVEVELLQARDLMWEGWEFSLLCKVRPVTRERLYTGSTDGFPSRSERDWSILNDLLRAGATDEQVTALLELSPAGDRYREEWPALLYGDLERAKQTVLVEAQTQDFIVHNNAWYTSGKTTRKVSTFVMETTALIEGLNMDEHFVVTIHAEGTSQVWNDVLIPSSAFADRRSLNRALGVAAWTWLGTDIEALALRSYLYQQVNAQGLPVLTGVQSMGRHGRLWVNSRFVLAPEGPVTPLEAGIIYVENTKDRPIVHSEPDLDFDELKALALEVFELAARSNPPELVLPLLAWGAACAFKPVLNQGGNQFPLMHVFGTRGSGKTSLIDELLLPVLGGYTDRYDYNCETTDFVVMSLMGASSSVPVHFAEYRSTMAYRERFERRLRLSYDAGRDARGRPDQSVTVYDLCAPLITDGEEVTDDSALLERTIVLRIRAADIEDRRDPEAWHTLLRLPRHRLYPHWAQWTLDRRFDPLSPELLGRVREASTFPVLPDRIQRSAAILLGGYDMLCHWLQSLGVNALPPPGPDTDKVLLGLWPSTVLGDETGKVRTRADDFVEAVINEIAQTTVVTGGSRLEGQAPCLWMYDPTTNQLRIHLSTAYTWWRKQNRMTGDTSIRRPTLKNLLQEQEYYLAEVSCRTQIGVYRMAEIDIAMVHASGLDVPADLLSINTWKVKAK
jgi:hypothetical protein